MDDARPEEKSPLLLYLVEGEENLSKNNKRVNFDKGRLYGISSGATAVFTEFPNYLSPCWLTAFLSSLIFFMMVLLVVTSMAPSNSIRIPRCTHSNSEMLSNKTIHLVHKWLDWTKEQLECLEAIKDVYEGYSVHLVLLKPWNKNITIASNSPKTIPSQDILKSTTSSVLNQEIDTKKMKRNKRNLKRKKREHSSNLDPIGIGFGVKSLLDILLRSKMDIVAVKRKNATEMSFFNLTEFPPTTVTVKPKTLEDILKNFPNLTVENVTLEEVFAKTPLQNSYKKLNEDLIVLAVRILHLWQYGGLSFKIDGAESNRTYWGEMNNFSVAPASTLQIVHHNSYENLPLTKPPPKKLRNFIINGKTIFENLPKEIVKADDEGSYFFTKSPCHVFFGEVLMNLRAAKGNESSKNILQQSLKVFCRHSAVGNNYCRNLIRKRG